MVVLSFYSKILFKISLPTIYIVYLSIYLSIYFTYAQNLFPQSILSPIYSPTCPPIYLT